MTGAALDRHINIRCRPLQRGGRPRIFPRGGSAAETPGEVDQKQELRRGKHERRVGDGDLDGDKWRKQPVGGVADSGKLRVVARIAAQSGEMHGKKRRVGEEDGQPEMPAAERFVHQARCSRRSSGKLRKPIRGRGEKAEDAGHRHDEVEVCNDEVRIVQVLV